MKLKTVVIFVKIAISRIIKIQLIVSKETCVISITRQFYHHLYSAIFSSQKKTRKYFNNFVKLFA